MYEFDPKFLQKVEELREMGVNPFPNGFKVTHNSTDIIERYLDVEDPTQDEWGKEVALGGRVMFRNRMGKVMFLRIQDAGEPKIPAEVDGEQTMLGGRIQLFVRKNDVGEETYEKIKKLDIGDFVWAKGHVFRTRTGELSVWVKEVQLAAKILSPFPDRYHSVSDTEFRSRQRYVDLFMNDTTRQTFRTRSKIVRYIRDFFEDRGFLEVETPMMHVIPGGAAARPFVTHHNTLDMELFLRIAPELFLKRLIVGGMDRVFEINRSFRNEGVSVRHNPEFTMLEYYQAWATHEDLIDNTEALLSGLVQHIHGTTKIPFADYELDFTPPFRRADMDELIAEKTSLTVEDLKDAAKIEAWWRENKRVSDDDKLPSSLGKWWELVYEEEVEHTLINPTFVTGFPAEISPLARRSDSDPFRTERFELVCATWEISNAFSELNDPVDQAERFLAQVDARADGDDEAMFFDADYIRALSYAMPPTAGQGIGIDRLVMLLTGQTNIREVILFPTLRPEQG